MPAAIHRVARPHRAARERGVGSASLICPASRLPATSCAGSTSGLDRFKFFPAEASGGIAAAEGAVGPLWQLRFCPTGGIRPDTAAEWLALTSVLCVGGSWLYRSGDDLEAVAERARAAAGLAPLQLTMNS